MNSRVLDRFDTDENGLVLAHGELSSVSRDLVQDERDAVVLGVEGDCAREVLDLYGLTRDARAMLRAM